MMNFALLLMLPAVALLSALLQLERGDGQQIERVADRLLRTPGAARLLRVHLLRRRAVARLAQRRAVA